MNPHISFRMELRRLLHAFQRCDLRQHNWQQPAQIEQLKPSSRRAFCHELRELFANSLRRNLADFSRVLANRFERFRFDLISKPCREAHRTQHAQLVFREAPARFADRAYDARAQIRLPINKIQYFAGVMPHHQAIDREVSPLYVFLR